MAADPKWRNQDGTRFDQVIQSIHFIIIHLTLLAVGGIALFIPSPFRIFNQFRLIILNLNLF